MIRRAMLLAGVVLGCLALIVLSGWTYVTHHSRLFIDRGGADPYVESGDVVPLGGPILEYPDGDMYLIYHDLHAFPSWLFNWSVKQQMGAAPSATIDGHGRLLAMSRGIVDVYVNARGGTAFGTTRLEILPRLDTIVLRVSRDTAAVGDTVTVSYVVVQADGSPMIWLGWPNLPQIGGDPNVIHLLSRTEHGQFAYRADRPGTARVSVRLGRRMSRASVTVR